MKIRMKKDMPGYPDGIHRQWFDKGKVYEVSDDFANQLLHAGFAEKTRSIKVEPENKLIKPIENKKK